MHREEESEETKLKRRGLPAGEITVDCQKICILKETLIYMPSATVGLCVRLYIVPLLKEEFALSLSCLNDTTLQHLCKSYFMAHIFCLTYLHKNKTDYKLFFYMGFSVFGPDSSYT